MKDNFKLASIKRNTIKLRSNYQLPKYLAYLILQLTIEDTKDKVRYLMELSEHYLRIKGYYQRYSSLASDYDAEIKKDYERRFCP